MPKTVTIEIRREGKAVATEARPLSGSHVVVAGQWREVLEDARGKYVEIGPEPVRVQRHPGPGRRGDLALLTMLGIVAAAADAIGYDHLGRR